MKRKSPTTQPDVYKFGGVAVGSAPAVRRAIQHVRAAQGPLAVIVSAMNGVTDLLLGAGQAAVRQDEKSYLDAANQFEQRHKQLVREIISSKPRATALRKMIAESKHEMVTMAHSISVLKELTQRAADTLVSRGERLLARIFAEALEENGVRAAFVDATDVIFTERRAGQIWPSPTKCHHAAQNVVVPLLNQKKVVIMPGYIGSGPDGEVVTLGRGGSDLSAAILAQGLRARAVTLFKEVDGLMTADPKSVPTARVLAELHYREAAELAYYGAKVLHPRTMIPLVSSGIPLLLRNSLREGSPGTRIAGDVKPGDYPVRALTAIHGQAMIAVEGKGMIGVPGVAGRTFTALAQAGHSVSMISQASSEASICFVLPEAETSHAVAALEHAFEMERKLRLIDRIEVQKRIALIAVVGLGMRGRPGIAARTFSALSGGGVNVVAIAQGSSELNITVAIAEGDVTAALRALHAEYQLDKVRPLADTSGRESKLTLLGFGQIGRALSKQLTAQRKRLRAEQGVDIQVIAIADRSGVKIEENGFSPAVLNRMAAKKASGARLFDRSSPLTLKQLQTMLRQELWLLPSHRPILVDLTSEETAPLIQEALEQGFHIVLANKKPLAVNQIEFDRLFQTARERNLSLRYEATAGAGLPVLDTLNKLQEAGDRIETIVGCFSGTLGYIMTAIEDGVPFADAVRQAWKLGYTEPDPREDLSGTDVARKALILARTLGRRLELSDIDLEPLYTPEVDDPDPARFIDKLRALNSDYAARVAAAQGEGKALRYVAKITKRGIRVGVEAVPESSPMGRLRGPDNQVAIYSKRYRTNPLVVTGPGAGAEVTAAGVLNDVVAITVEERRRTRR